MWELAIEGGKRGGEGEEGRGEERRGEERGGEGRVMSDDLCTYMLESNYEGMG